MSERLRRLRCSREFDPSLGDILETKSAHLLSGQAQLSNALFETMSTGPKTRRSAGAVNGDSGIGRALPNAMPRTEVGDDVVLGAEARLARARAAALREPADPSR